MPATSEAMRRLMGAALAQKRGQLTQPSTKIKRVARRLSIGQLRDFARKPGIHSKGYRYHNKEV